MEQVVLKPKNLAHSEVQVKPIQILRCSEAAPVDTEPDAAPLSDIIQAAYNNLAESDPVATVSQILRDSVRCHSSGPVVYLAQVTHLAGKFHLHAPCWEVPSALLPVCSTVA